LKNSAVFCWFIEMPEMGEFVDRVYRHKQ